MEHGIIVDARGQSCPIPVAMTKKAVRDMPKALTVLVDSANAVENVTRFGESYGYTVVAEAEQDEWSLQLEKA